jgi:hypothetical protein
MSASKQNNLINDLFKVIGGERYRGCWIAPVSGGGLSVMGKWFETIELARAYVDECYVSLKDLKVN